MCVLEPRQFFRLRSAAVPAAESEFKPSEQEEHRVLLALDQPASMGLTDLRAMGTNAMTGERP